MPEIRINTKCPVPTGTDCSESTPGVSTTVKSRPYGDGLFFEYGEREQHRQVPSLRGRIVPECASARSHWKRSRPYGDGLFLLQPYICSLWCVPSLRGRIVLLPDLSHLQTTSPVPTGTDCSVSTPMSLSKRGSRPYGDGLFLHLDIKKYQSGVPSLRGRIVPFCRCFWTARVGPVPTGTDCSINICATTDDHRSRPYGDGLFRGQQDDLSFYNGPVPTGTDCSLYMLFCII